MHCRKSWRNILAAGLFVAAVFAVPGEATARKLTGRLLNLDDDSHSYLIKCPDLSARNVIDAETEERLSYEGCTIAMERNDKPVGARFKLTRLSSCTIKRGKLSCN
jgi:hypothetical protein